MRLFLTSPDDSELTSSDFALDGNFGAALGQLQGTSDMNWDNPAAFTAINTQSVTSPPQTISPKDLHPELASAPPSTAFTNLTSPDINESPYKLESYDTSPLFQNDGTGLGNESWPSLFPDDPVDNYGNTLFGDNAAHANTDISRTMSHQSLAQTSSSDNSPLVGGAAMARKTSNDRPLSQTVPRNSSTSGISKPRRRKGPLPDIHVDPNDKVAIKRARNTLAARESRQRKYEHTSLLEGRVSELEAEIAERDDTIARLHQELAMYRSVSSLDGLP